ncbi:CHAT domain-containing tetratricopeptide repeat protein [Capilliphycus salinus ALCB114379]|uniref:CHAT domain-containing tetratricopeptide repeat protein n=1 Tax=Capilliphycus salinus TaxID=2768948 RepID=UPI0039A40F84
MTCEQKQNKILNRWFYGILQVTFLLSLLLSGKIPPVASDEPVNPSNVWDRELTEKMILAANPKNPAQEALKAGLNHYRQGTGAALRLAIEQLEIALKLWREQGDFTQEATTLQFLGLIHSDLGEYQAALNYYRQVLQLLPELSQPEYWEAPILELSAEVYFRWGEYQKALEAYEKAYSLRQQIGIESAQAATLNSIGLVYYDLGELDRALKYYQQAQSLLQRSENSGDLKTTALILNNIGQVYSEQGELEKAKETYEQALNYWRALPSQSDIRNIRGQAATLNNKGYIFAQSNQLQIAQQTYNEALPLWQKIGDRTREASTLNNLCYVDFKQGNLAQALEICTQSLQIRQTVGDKSKEPLSLYYIAQIQREQGQLEAAVQTIETALEIIEDLRTKVDRQDLRTSFFASKQEYYQFYIDLLMQLHKQNPEKGFDGLALQASERAKARSLLEILAESGGEVTSGIDPKLLEEKKQLQQQLSALEQLRVRLLSGEHTEEQRITINGEIDNLLQQYRTLLSEIRATSPHYAALTQPQPLTLGEIQQQILDSETVLLEYSLGENRSYLWVVTPNSIESYELPGREEIETKVTAFRDSFLLPNQRIRRTLAENAGKELAEMILPESEKLSQKRLLIVADGVLQYVPFNALPTPGTLILEEDWTPLIVSHEIVTLPSASTLAVLRQEIKGRTPAPKALAIVADPVFSYQDERVKNVAPEKAKSLSPELERSARESGVLFDRLPFTEKEAERILDLIPTVNSTKQFGFSARREFVTSQQMSQYRILHFATHGLLNSETPELSGLVLSLVDKTGEPLNGFLRLYDIFNLNLSAELAVLSACETGLGENIKGEGLVGLTRGFMYAGAPRVVVSLWKVDDQATSELMVKFYQRMLQQNLSPVAALRVAQIDMWQQNKWSSPYFWAAFTLQGEWQPPQ